MRKYLLIAAALLTFVLAFSLFGKTGLINLYKAEKKNSEIRAKLSKLEAENRELREEIEKLKSDPEYLERVAREDLGMVKKDELVFQLAEDEQP